MVSPKPLKRGLAMKTLIIKLAGPLQSYGNEATFNRRTSYHYPSKSAVLGMIAAALGYRRDDSRIRKLNQVQMAVRIDQPGRTMTDFQTVEYDQKRQKRSLSYRDYLQDAVFVVAISGEDKVIEDIQFALHHPKFQLYLGRRANVPAGPLKTKIFGNSNPIEVLRGYPWQAAKWYQQRHRQYMAEVILDADLMPDARFITYEKDNIGSFNQDHRWHSYRAITDIHMDLKNKDYQEPSTGHDAFASI